MKKMRCQSSKVVGTIVTVAGAMLMTLYKAPLWSCCGPNIMLTATLTSQPIIFKPHTLQLLPQTNNGSLAPFSLSLPPLPGLAFCFTSKSIGDIQNHNLSLTSLMCFIGTLQAIAVTFVMEHNPSVWKIGFDMNLLAAAYAGIVTSSLTYYVQGLVINKKGPVFATAFSPLMMIIVAIMGSFILAEKIYLGGVIGSILIVIGLYSVLWGKHKERVESKVNEVDQDIALPMKASPVDANNNNNNNNKYADDKQLTINEAKSEKGDKSISKIDSVHISMPHSNQEPKA
ncbi:WAT1-related protein At5g07050-like [Prosopis cineraria]|uniref:WAT1-related protein At5g07050-like n=1 Tax=Prosopis cineraria TaxID=364024 RepID=UPI00240EF5D4|nr:WAT1-related protein At5g07050-like [Prosopis cineraria]